MKTKILLQNEEHIFIENCHKNALGTSKWTGGASEKDNRQMPQKVCR